MKSSHYNPHSWAILTGLLVLMSITPRLVLSAPPSSDDATQAEALTPPRTVTPDTNLIRLPDSYVELYRQILALPSGKQRPGFETDAALASVALRLWERTHEEAYRKITAEKFAKAFSDPKFSLADFHILHHFGELIWRMKKDGLLTTEQHQKLIQLAKEELTKYLKQPDDTLQPPGIPLFNIRIAQILGYTGLLRFLEGEDFDQQQAVSARLNSYFDLLVKLGNTDEDAQNYDSLGMAFAIDLARLLGRGDDLKSPGFRRYFENFRDIVTPSGLVPEYGDSYFGYDDVPMDRIFLMEHASRLFNDPTYLEARDKMWMRPQQGLPPEDHWIRSLSLIDLPDSKLTAQPITGIPSQVLLRNVPGTKEPAPDKLILRSAREPGSSMIMMDLYASGSHAAKDKGPSIGYYEFAQVPLFHNMGRRGTRSAIDGNICWARPPSERFPGLWNHPGEWFTMTMPVDIISTNSEGKFVLSRMDLRNFPENHNNRGCTRLLFDNLRLVGPSGTLLLDNFDSTEGWSRNLSKFTLPVASPDKTEGNASQSIAWNKVNASIQRTLPTPCPPPFTRDQYTQLKLDVKYEGSRPYILVRGFGDEIEIGAHELRPKLNSARTEQSDRDAMGQVSYDRYIQDDTTLTRRIVLTSEGYLLIRDVLTPGPSMNGWNAGQLWQLYTLAAHGDHWFCSDDDGTYPNVSKNPSESTTRKMFVRFASDGETVVGFEEAKQEYTYPNPKGRPGTSFFTTYSERKIQTGHPEVFSMVVVPIDPLLMPSEELAKNVSITQSSDGSIAASVLAGGKQTLIHLGENDWSVKR